MCPRSQGHSVQDLGFPSKGWSSRIYFISTQPLELMNRLRTKNAPLKSSASRLQEAPGELLLRGEDRRKTFTGQSPEEHGTAGE